MAWHTGKPHENDELPLSALHIRENFAELEPLQPHVLSLLLGRIAEHNLDDPSPANGRYVRFEVGIQVCWHSAVVGMVSDFTSTFNNLPDQPMPKPFTGAVTGFVGVSVGSSSASIRGVFSINGRATLNAWDRLVLIRHPDGTGANQPVEVHYVAVGLWK